MEKVLLIIIGDENSNSYKSLNIFKEVIKSEIIELPDTHILKVDRHIVDLKFAKNVSELNQIINLSELNYICVLPENVFLPNNWLTELIIAHKTTNVNCGVVGIISDFSNKEFSSVFCDQNDDFPIDIILSECIDGVMLFDRSAIDSIGYFDCENEYYLENYCLRLSLFGYTNFYLSDKCSIVFKEKISESQWNNMTLSLKNKNTYICFSTF